MRTRKHQTKSLGIHRTLRRDAQLVALVNTREIEKYVLDSISRSIELAVPVGYEYEHVSSYGPSMRG